MRDKISKACQTVAAAAEHEEQPWPGAREARARRGRVG